MSIPPSDPGYGQPPVYPAPIPSSPAAQSPVLAVPVPGAKHKHITRTVLIIALAAAVVTALTVVFIHRSLSGGAGQTPLEAIDLASQPSLGTPWNATDGNPRDENIDAKFFVTPCGIFVSALIPDFSHRDLGLNARIVGYEISSGNKAWEVSLKDVTGLASPSVEYDTPTYTANCTMVVMVSDQTSGVFTKVGLAVDLSTGEANAFYTGEEIRGCAALASNRAGCWESPRQMQIVDLASGASKTLDMNSFSLAPPGEVIVNGMISSPQGYQDPASGKVVFGRDIDTLTWKDDWVAYVEAKQPGGFDSGVAVRVEGSKASPTGPYSIMAWNTQTDKGLWSAPASLPCSHCYRLAWTVTDSALIVTADSEDETRAYSLKDGRLLWENEASLFSNGWSRAIDPLGVGGLTSYYAIFLDKSFNQSLVRISDGTTIPFDHDDWDLMTASQTMAYAEMYRAGTRHLAAFSLDGSDDPVWTLDLPEDARPWTFATGGTMYVVYGGHNEPAWVIPLIE